MLTVETTILTAQEIRTIIHTIHANRFSTDVGAIKVDDTVHIIRRGQDPLIISTWGEWENIVAKNDWLQGPPRRPRG